ncbi:MAG TPA: HD domain-containing phosphohydrolase [Pseudobdellovibrionaceae bacterium]|nr:HD domain-containing phosphohydrolase [Pseudobdellovibrionaceae bacterium]
MSHLPIRVNTLRGDQKIDFDVYIKIADKMILYVRKGDSFEGPRLTRLKEKKLKKMFIMPEEESLYRNYVQRNITMAYDDKSGKDIQTRTEIIHGQQQSNVEEVFENPEAPESYQAAKDGASKYVQFLMNNETALQSVFHIENTDRSLSHHGVSVATLSVGLAKRLKLEDPKVVQMMSLGALLHDFGHPEGPWNPLHPAYKQHPDIGSARVQDKKHFDQLVINIIAQHEECIDGSGFPRGLKENEMDQTVIIVSTCNAFDRYVAFEGFSRAEAGKKMMLERVGRHPLGHIQQLIELAKG